MLSITRILPFVPICLSGFIYAVFRFLLLLYIFRVQYNTSVLMGHRLSFEVSDTQHKSISFPRCTEHHGFRLTYVHSARLSSCSVLHTESMLRSN
ncbi:hypothetical protein AcW1_002394 [Taiwanofungus camphoratus]|nr:hypothetical protein AcW1_002394 [Antrodia cinnamomea]